MNTFLTADEDDQLQFSARFLEAVADQAWGDLLVIGYPGVPTMALGAFGLWVEEHTPFLDQVFSADSLLPEPDPFSSVVASPVQIVQGEYTLFFPLLVKPPEPVVAPPPRDRIVIETPLEFITAVRVPLLFVYALTLVVIFVALRILLNEFLAITAILMLIFDPFIMAHSRVIHVDAPLSYFMFSAFALFLVYLKRGQWYWLIFSGLFGALAVLSKTPGVLLGPILLVGGFCYIWLDTSPSNDGEQGAQRRVRRLAIALAVWGLIAVIGFVILWPSMWSRPIYAVTRIVNNAISITQFESHPSSGVFWGITRSDRSPYYYLLTIPYHLTPLATIGFAGAIGMLIIGLRDRRQNIVSYSSQHLPLLTSFVVFIVLFVLPISIVSRRIDRYALPVHFVVDVMAVLGLWMMGYLLYRGWRWLQSRWQITVPDQATPTTIFYMVLVVVFIQIIQVGLHYPYYFTYYNPLLGGAPTASRLINIGFGEGLKQAADYLNQKQDASDNLVAAWYSWQFAHYFSGHSIDLASNEPAYIADYTVFYINQVQRGFPSRELLDYFQDRVPEQVITLHDLDYAWIYPGPMVDTVPPDEVPQYIGAPFQEQVQLLGLDVPEMVQGYQEFPITLYWHTIQPLPDDFNVSIRVVDETGHVWGQTDRFPLGGLIRTRDWLPNLYIQDEYLLALEAGTPPGMYHFDILMYNFETNDVFAQVRQTGKLQVIPSDPIEDLSPIVDDRPDVTVSDIGPSLTLLHDKWIPRDVDPATRQHVKLTWHASEKLSSDYQVSLLGRSKTGGIIPLNTVTVGDTYPIAQWPANQVVSQLVPFAFPVDAPPGTYDLLLKVNDAEAQVLGPLMLQEVNRTFETPPDLAQASPLQATFGDDIQLVGYTADLEPETKTLSLKLFWTTSYFLDNDYKIFVHGVDAGGNIATQQDRYPLQGERQTSTWAPGEYLVDTTEIMLDDTITAIWVGLYNPLTLERLSIMTDADVSENRLRIPIEFNP
ncbi:MAG: phospholipid carrier-dependent glycosyltransferase [Chloroflexota bacterium]